MRQTAFKIKTLELPLKILYQLTGYLCLLVWHCNQNVEHVILILHASALFAFIPKGMWLAEFCQWYPKLDIMCEIRISVAMNVFKIRQVYCPLHCTGIISVISLWALYEYVNRNPETLYSANNQNTINFLLQLSWIAGKHECFCSAHLNDWFIEQMPLSTAVWW